MRAPPLTGMFPAPTTSSLKAVFATVPRVALLIFHQRSPSGAPMVNLAPTCFIRPKGRGGGRGRRQGSCADLATIGGDRGPTSRSDDGAGPFPSAPREPPLTPYLQGGSRRNTLTEEATDRG